MKHPYHIVDKSPWPATCAMGAFIFVICILEWIHGTVTYWSTVVLVILGLWWRDVVRERTYIGKHTRNVQKGLGMGMLLFIVREVFFFFSFFWSFFHSSLCGWPPEGIFPVSPYGVPLLNTVVLLSSGATVTWAHLCLLNDTVAFWGLVLTIFLGSCFTLLQYSEYLQCSFTISDSIYGRVFFVSTGFHGLHVIIGTIFLIVCLFRHVKGHFSSLRHFGFECGAWYWHFVDVVWLFLFICVYWWGY